MISVSFCLAIVLPCLLWFSMVGDPRLYMHASVPSGQLVYVLSKLAGLMAVGVFALQLLLVALRVTRFGPNINQWGHHAHQRLGLFTGFLILTHIGLFITAASLRSQHFAVHLLLPRFNSGYYDAMVSIGALAFYVITVALIMGLAMRRFSKSVRVFHIHRALILVCSPLVIIHSFAIGSETNSLPVFAFYFFMFAVVVVYSLRKIRFFNA